MPFADKVITNPKDYWENGVTEYVPPPPSSWGERGVFGGGGPTTSLIDYVTIATTGNAINFGNLTLARSGLAACSGN